MEELTISKVKKKQATKLKTDAKDSEWNVAGTISLLGCGPLSGQSFKLSIIISSSLQHFELGGIHYFSLVLLQMIKMIST